MANQTELDRFKRRLIRTVARFKEQGAADIWEQVEKSMGKDCRTVWDRMRSLTLKKMTRLRSCQDTPARLSPNTRMSITDWLMLDLVLVHEDIDTIDLTAAEEPPQMVMLLTLVQDFKLEMCPKHTLSENWAAAAMHYNKNGRQCSPMLLQRRWYDLKAITRHRFYRYWQFYRQQQQNSKSGNQVEMDQRDKPTELNKAIATKYPYIITSELPTWPELLKEGMIVLPFEFEKILNLKDQPKNSTSDDTDDVVLIEPVIETIDVDLVTELEEEVAQNSSMDTSNKSDGTHTIADKEAGLINIEVNIDCIESPEMANSENDDVEIVHISNKLPQTDTGPVKMNNEDIQCQVENLDNITELDENAHETIEIRETTGIAESTIELNTEIIIKEEIEEPNGLSNVRIIALNHVEDTVKTELQINTSENYSEHTFVEEKLQANVQIPVILKVETMAEETIPVAEISAPIQTTNPENGTLNNNEKLFYRPGPKSKKQLLSSTPAKSILQDMPSAPAARRSNKPGPKCTKDLSYNELENNIVTSPTSDSESKMKSNSGADHEACIEILESSTDSSDEATSGVKDASNLNTKPIPKDIDSGNSNMSMNVDELDDDECNFEFAEEDDEIDLATLKSLEQQHIDAVNAENTGGDKEQEEVSLTTTTCSPTTFEDPMSNTAPSEERPTNKFDLKLLMLPVVYTLKLDAMDVLNGHNLNYTIFGNDTMDNIEMQSKPKSNEFNLQDEMNQSESNTCDEDGEDYGGECLNESHNYSDESVDETEEQIPKEPQIVKDTNYIFQKPKTRTYTPINLCKNPDFNTRLRRLSVAFLMQIRNRQQLKACIPLTVDLHKAFEEKLVDGMIIINRSEENHQSQNHIAVNDIDTQKVTVAPSAMPAQSLFDKETVNINSLLPPISKSSALDSKSPVLVSTNLTNDKESVEEPELCSSVEKKKEELLRARQSKAIQLPDIEKVRLVNKQLLTAQVTPLQMREKLEVVHATQEVKERDLCSPLQVGYKKEVVPILEVEKDKEVVPPLQVEKEKVIVPALQVEKENEIVPALQVEKEKEVVYPLQVEKKKVIVSTLQMEKEKVVVSTLQVEKEHEVILSLQMQKEDEDAPELLIEKENKVTSPLPLEHKIYKVPLAQMEDKSDVGIPLQMGKKYEVISSGEVPEKFIKDVRTGVNGEIYQEDRNLSPVVKLKTAKKPVKVKQKVQSGPLPWYERGTNNHKITITDNTILLKIDSLQRMIQSLTPETIPNKPSLKKMSYCCMAKRHKMLNAARHRLLINAKGEVTRKRFQTELKIHNCKSYITCNCCCKHLLGLPPGKQLKGGLFMPIQSSCGLSTPEAKVEKKSSTKTQLDEGSELLSALAELETQRPINPVEDFRSAVPTTSPTKDIQADPLEETSISLEVADDLVTENTDNTTKEKVIEFIDSDIDSGKAAQLLALPRHKQLKGGLFMPIQSSCGQSMLEDKFENYPSPIKQMDEGSELLNALAGLETPRSVNSVEDLRPAVAVVPTISPIKETQVDPPEVPIISLEAADEQVTENTDNTTEENVIELIDSDIDSDKPITETTNKLKQRKNTRSNKAAQCNKSRKSSSDSVIEVSEGEIVQPAYRRRGRRPREHGQGKSITKKISTKLQKAIEEWENIKDASKTAFGFDKGKKLIKDNVAVFPKMHTNITLDPVTIAEQDGDQNKITLSKSDTMCLSIDTEDQMQLPVSTVSLDFPVGTRIMLLSDGQVFVTTEDGTPLKLSNEQHALLRMMVSADKAGQGLMSVTNNSVFMNTVVENNQTGFEDTTGLDPSVVTSQLEDVDAARFLTKETSSKDQIEPIENTEVSHIVMQMSDSENICLNVANSDELQRKEIQEENLENISNDKDSNEITPLKEKDNSVKLVEESPGETLTGDVTETIVNTGELKESLDIPSKKKLIKETIIDNKIDESSQDPIEVADSPDNPDENEKYETPTTTGFLSVKNFAKMPPLRFFNPEERIKVNQETLIETTSNPRSILSDLMEISGISAEDTTPAPPVEQPLTLESPLILQEWINTGTSNSLVLTPITPSDVLSNSPKGKFYVLNSQSGQVIPVNLVQNYVSPKVSPVKKLPKKADEQFIHIAPKPSRPVKRLVYSNNGKVKLKILKERKPYTRKNSLLKPIKIVKIKRSNLLLANDPNEKSQRKRKRKERLEAKIDLVDSDAPIEEEYLMDSEVESEKSNSLTRRRKRKWLPENRVISLDSSESSDDEPLAKIATKNKQLTVNQKASSEICDTKALKDVLPQVDVNKDLNEATNIGIHSISMNSKSNSENCDRMSVNVVRSPKLYDDLEPDTCAKFPGTELRLNSTEENTLKVDDSSVSANKCDERKDSEVTVSELEIQDFCSEETDSQDACILGI